MREMDVPASEVAMSDKPKLFDAGHVVRTFGALMAMVSAQASEWSVLERHMSGDFGDIDAVRRRRNEEAIAHTGCVMSIYSLRGAVNLWVVTEREQRMTTLLLADEFARRFPDAAHEFRAA
jgi:hypothetical protein